MNRPTQCWGKPIAACIVSICALLAFSLESGCDKKPETPPAAQGGSTPGSGSKTESTPQSASGVTIDAPASAGKLSATEIKDLADLRKKTDGQGLLAAATFGPDGATFPDGITITWPLTEARPAGERLWIATLDAAEARWLNTRQRATVDASGRRASGKVYHFSDFGLLPQPPSKDDDKTPRVQTNTVFVHTDGHHAVKVDPKKLERVKQIYEQGGGAGKAMTKARTIELYKAGDYATLKTLIESGVISPQHSMDMADMRLLMVLETWEHIIRTQGKGKWKIYRSDSGNQKAGMGSDMDQTIKVYELRDGKWVRVESLDWELVEFFRKEFPGLHSGLSIEAMDIATIAARDNPPEWRTTSAQLEAENKRLFNLHDSETLFTLRRTPGAYTYTGAIVQQVQLRVLDMVERNLRTTAEQPVAPGQRAFHPELAAHVGSLQPNNMLFTCIAPDESGSGEIKPREVFQEEAVVELFDGLKPALIRGHAYDASVANYFEFMHHLNDKFPAVKYHLRALDDGLQAIERLKKGVARFEYANLHSAQRAEHLAGLLGQDLAAKQWDGHSFIDRWKVAFDVSAKMRDLHSAKKLNDQSYAEALEPLVREIFGEAGDIRNPEHIAKARAEYNQRCQEFFLHNMIQTSEHRIAEFLRPAGDDKAAVELFKTALDEGTLRRKLGIEGPQHDAKWQAVREEMVRNYSDQARNQLLYSLRELAARPDVIKLIMDRAKAKGYAPAEIAQLNAVLTESRSWLFNYREYKKFPETYRLFAYLAAKKGVQYFANKAWEGVKTDLGFIEAPEGPRPSNLLKSLGPEGLRTKVDAFLKRNALFAAAERRFGNAFLHIGAAQGAANVLRAYSEHDGDPIEFGKAVLRESAMLIFPHLGLAYGAYEAGTDWKQQALLVLCCISPTGGVIMVAVTIGEAGMAIYEHDYVEPLKNLTSDAIYRGYIGPSLYDFSMEGNVSPFSDEDDARLQKLEDQVTVLRKRIEGGGGSKGDAQLLAELGRDAKPLQMHRSAWKAFAAEQKKLYEGSSLLGKGAAPRQLVLELGPVVKEPFTNEPIAAAGSLLGRVQPVIFYSRNRHEGAVDFTVPALSAAEKARMDELEKSIPAMADPVAAVDAEGEYESLRRRNASYERAQRYIARAATNHELMLQIRRDSMYPSMLRDAGIAKMYDAKNFVETWLAIRREMLPDALKKIGLDSSLSPWDERVREELQDRVWTDLERSKRLWLAHQMLVKGEQEAEKQAIEARKCQVAQAMMLDAVRDGVVSLSKSVQQAMVDASVDLIIANSTATMGEAIFERHTPVPVPSVSVRIRELPNDNKKTGMRVRLEHDVKVTADPSVYLPPYFSIPYVLDPKQAQEAVASRQWMGLPLDDGMIKHLQQYLKDVEPMIADFKPQDDPFDPALLVFVFCTDQRIPQRVIPETVEDLPVLKAYDIRTPKGMDEPPSQMRRGYLLGGAAGASKAVNAPTGPLMITVRRWPNNEVANAIEVRSEALAKLDEKDANTGVKLKILRARDAAGPWEEMDDYFTGYVYGGREIRDDSKVVSAGSYRPAKNVFILRDHNSPVGAFNQKPGDKPVHYQVVQVPIQRAGAGAREVGKEVRSNIVSPGSETLMVLNCDKGPDGEPKPYNGVINLFVQLGLQNQYFHFSNPHAVATAGGRPTHFWNSGRVQTPPEGGVVSVTAEAEGFSGTASITIKPDDDWLKRLAASLESARKDLAARERDIPKELEISRKSLAELQGRKINKPADGKFGPWANEALLRLTGISSTRAYIEFESKRVLNLYRMNVARAQRDFSAALALAEGELALIAGLESIEAEERQSLQGLLAEVQGAPAPDDGTRRSKDEFIKSLQARISPSGVSADQRRAGAYVYIMNLAYDAGDPAAFARAADTLASLYMKGDSFKHNLAQVYMDASAKILEMTGDASRAAAYYTKGIEAQVRANPSSADSIRKQAADGRPPWWPADPSAPPSKGR